MEHWYAKNTSKAADDAANAVRSAEKRLQETLRSEYPLGAAVRVVHYHGEYTGTIEGHDYHGCRLLVKNDATGKSKKWWSRHVELVRHNS